MAKDGKEAVVPEVSPEQRTVLVEGITPDISEQLLELYFEQPKYGGGDIEKITIESPKKARIVFRKPEDAETVLQHNHVFSGHQLRVSKVNTRANETAQKAMASQDPKSQRAVLVAGLKPSIGKDILEMFFENTKRSGGGEIKQIEINEESGRAIIHFADEAVSQRVAKRGKFTLSGCELTVAPLTEEAKVKISGVCDKTSRMALELFFESPKRSDGGDIKEMIIKEGKAFITFDDPAVVDRIVARGTFVLNGCSLTAERCYTSLVEDGKATNQGDSDEEFDFRSVTIEVSGVKKETSDEIVKMFFTNSRISGGGDIDNIWYDKDSGKYIVTFSERVSVDRILKRPKLILDGAILSVSVVESSFQKEKHLKGTTESDKIYVTGLNGKITRTQLELYMDKFAECEVVDVFYGLNPEVAMVTFKDKIDFAKIQKAIVRKPVEGRLLGVERVPSNRSVQVFNIGHMTNDSLVTYFENKRSGGSGEVTVNVNRQQGYAIVTFENHVVANEVLARKSHEFDNQTLKVSAYRHKFGIIPLNHDTSQPSVQIPTHVNITGIDPLILQYWRNIPLAGERLEKELAKLHSQLDPNFNIDKELRILCTITEDDIETRSHAKGWATDVKESVNALASGIQVKRRLCVKKIWDLVLGKARKIKQENKAIFLIEKDDESAIYIVGPTTEMNTVYNQFDGICFELEQSMELIKSKIELKGTDTIVFRRSVIMERLTKDRPKMKILIGVDKVELEGPARDILDTQNEIHSFIQRIEHRKIQLSVGKLKVLKALLQQQNSYLELSMKNLAAVIQIEDTSAVVSGESDDVKKCEEILESDIKEKAHKISKEEQVAVNGMIWTSFKNSVNVQCKGVLYLEFQKSISELNIASHKTDFDMISEKLQQHLRKNTIKTVSLQLDKLQVKYIQRHMEKDLRQIEQSLSSYSIKVELSDNYDFKILGTEDGLNAAKKRVEGLKDKIRTEKYAINSPGMLNYLKNEEMGQLFIKHQEDTHQVLIHHGDFVQVKQEKMDILEEPAIMKSPKIQEDTFPKPFFPQHVSAVRSTTTKEIRKVTHPSGVIVKAVVGDLTRHPVELIVNAANGKLKHIGGLAKAIVDRGGSVIQDECNQYVQIHGTVKDGHAVLTGAGNLSCKNVIHAVGPQWRGGQFGEEGILYDCIFSHVLEITCQENFSSIAIPAISAGVFGFPIAVSTSVIVKAIKDFLDNTKAKSTSLEIHLVDSNEESVRSFATALSKHFEAMQSFPKFSMKDQVSVDRRWMRNGPNAVRTTEGIVVTIKKGTIDQEQVDILLNTTSRSLHLSSGAVSGTILKAAGTSIQDEVNFKCPNGLQDGEHVTSSGGNLSVKIIIHAVLCNWNRGKDIAEKMLHKIVTETLNVASQKGFTTVAFPALGTGNLGFPRNIAAETMFNAINQFSKVNSTSVKDVRVVLYHKDQPTIDAFEKHMSNLVEFTNVSSSGVASSGPKIAAVEPMIATRVPRNESISNGNFMDSSLEGAVGGLVRPYEMVRPVSQYQTPTGAGEGGEIKISSILLQVVLGNIVNETTDAIVNGTSEDLDLSQGAVCKAVAEAGGSLLVLQCKLKGRTGRNGTAVTGGGALSVKHVIHLNVRNKTTEKEWKMAITSCLEEAELLGLTSLSFPTLGTGMLHKSTDKMALTMMEAVAEYSRRNKGTCISLVRVVVFQADMIAKYIDEMKKAGNSGSSIFDVVTAPFRSARKFFKEVLQPNNVKGAATPKRDLDFEKPVVSVENHSQEFIIVGIRVENILAAKAELGRFCLRESANGRISGMEFSDIIKSLNTSQIRSLIQLGESFGVKVTIERGKLPSAISIQGHKLDVYKADSKIKGMLFKIKSESMEHGASYDTPVEWAPMNGESTKIVQLIDTNQEYRHVAGQFAKSCSKKIIKIERLQSEYLFRRYMVHKEYMRARGPKATQYEKQLWHGTTIESISKINANGFNSRFCGKNAVVYGQGVYFATDASYSEKYSRADSNGQKKMYYARVLTGEYIKGDSSMRMPPYKSSESLLHYDSTVNKNEKPTIFVIYNDNQAYPEYIVTFQS